MTEKQACPNPTETFKNEKYAEKHTAVVDREAVVV